MEYSKITTIELINFMSFKKAKVAFDETGIINIKGYNDSGKSAILRGLAVCLMDMFKQKQAKFIRHGEEYFRVVVSFDDGVSIVRDKYRNGQSLYEVYKNGERIFTTKQGNKLAKIYGVPKQIEDYLGLCVTDSVYLNYQSCVDPLPVVDTRGSENYQMFHEVLRTEEIYRAGNMINTDKNALGSEIAEIELDIQRNEILLERCKDINEEFIEEIQKLEAQAESTENKKEALTSISDIANRCDSFVDIPKVEMVSYENLKDVKSIETIVNSLESVKEVPEIKKISLGRLAELQNIVKAVDYVEDFVDIPEVPKVSENLIQMGRELQGISGVVANYNDVSAVCKSINHDLKSTQAELYRLVESAREQGIEFVKCDNCGSYTLLEGGHTHDD